MVSHADKDEQPVTTSEIQVEKKAMNLAASWYIAMPSKELGEKTQAIELFSRALVVWRDKLGKPVIMERFCSHTGASLETGQVVDGCIQCPCHDWGYDSSGACVYIPKLAIPQINVILPTAHQKTFVTEERYGYIWVWYGSATPLFDLPEFDCVENNKHNYCPYRFSFPVKTSVRRVMENAFDSHHFDKMRNLPIIEQIKQTLLNEEDVELSELPISKEAWIGSLIEARIKSFIGVGAIAKALGLNLESVWNRIDVWPSGFISTTKFNGQQKQKIKVLTSFTPISENQIIWQFLVTIDKTDSLWLALLSYIVSGWQTKARGLQDKLIFNTMSADKNRSFIKPDKPVLKFREFYQSWVSKVQSN